MMSRSNSWKCADRACRRKGAVHSHHNSQRREREREKAQQGAAEQHGQRVQTAPQATSQLAQAHFRAHLVNTPRQLLN